MKNVEDDKSISQQGFTLIEVLIAMVILGIGIMSITALQVDSVGRNSGSKRQSQSYTWAMDQVERLLSLPYTDADLTVQGNPATIGDGHTVARAPYTVEWDVTDNGAQVTNSRLVNVFVRWNGREEARVDFTRVATPM